jgi:DNA invertase Pin-like site-specific DNA recombinase
MGCCPDSNGGKRMIAAGYIRVSVAREEGVSPDIQRQAVEQYCQAKGWSVVQWFTDLDVSGRTDQRPALQEMIRQAQDGQFQAVVFYRIDRLSREPMHHYAILHALREAGVLVDSVGLPADDSPENAFMWDLSAALAKLESLRHGKRIRDSHRTLREKGRFAGGHAPYGFRYADPGPGLEPDPTEAPWVIRMHEWFHRGWTITRIAQELNARRVPARRGGKWLASTVLRVLQHPTAAGGRLRDGTLVTGGNITPIVSEETWRRTQSLMRGNLSRWQAGKTSQGPLPTRIIRCGSCGRSLRVHYRGPGEKTQLRCWARNDGACPRGVSIYAHLVEAAMQEKILARLKGMKGPPPEGRRLDVDLATMEQEIESTRAALERLAIAYAEGAMELPEYQGARKQLVARMERLGAKHEKQAAKVETALVREGVRYLWDDLSRLSSHPELLSEMPALQRRELYQLLVERVIVHPAGTKPSRIEVLLRF